MAPFSVLKFVSILGFAVSALAATCEVAGGTSDDGPAIAAALSTCNNGGTVVLDKTYTLATVLQTTALNNVAIQLTGTIKLSPEISYWKASGVQLTYQSAYTAWTIGGSGIHIYGGGTFNASGDTWYAAGTTGPIPWVIYNAKNVLVENINMVQSPFWHNFIYQSSNVTFNNINLNSIQTDGSQAQNTDGWDIYRSSNIAITNSHIINGDDCVSLKPNSTNVLVQNLYCQGSHGISMGSVGQYAGVQDIIQNVLVKNITMVNAENGARIKAFGGSSSSTSTTGGGNGYVQNITFQDFKCDAVTLPIVIDQCYETSTSTCASYPSKVLINDIHYINVTGTGTKSKEVVSMVCSDVCGDITAVGTSLVGTSGSSEYYCTNIGSLTSLDFPCSVAGSVVSSSKSSTTTKKTTTKTTTTKTSTTSTKTTTTT
jgi:galacturan 1,4-alpha-galacturonidase